MQNHALATRSSHILAARQQKADNITAATFLIGLIIFIIAGIAGIASLFI